MIILEYSPMLVPVEYNIPTSDRTPFRLYYYTIPFVHTVFAHTTNTVDLKSTTLAILELTTQKNGGHGEKFGLGASAYPLLFPTTALLHRILSHKDHNAVPTAPLSLFLFPTAKWNNITPIMISWTLKFAVNYCCPDLGFTSKVVFTHSFHASEDM